MLVCFELLAKPFTCGMPFSGEPNVWEGEWTVTEDEHNISNGRKLRIMQWEVMKSSNT
jgi:hypothetical protein